MITQERKNEIIGYSYDETNDEYTRDWRNDLTDEEQKFVDLLDKKHNRGLYNLCKAIITAHERAVAEGRA
jgi:endo-beta-N-acetylglucosaminidase D